MILRGMTLVVFAWAAGCSDSVEEDEEEEQVEDAADEGPEATSSPEQEEQDLQLLQAEDFVNAAIQAAYPGADELGRIEVLDPTGGELGVLMMFALNEEDDGEAGEPCEAFFCGPDQLSVLVSDLPDLPMVVMSTAGVPEDVESSDVLFYDPRGMAWYVEEDGGLRPVDGGESLDLSTLAPWTPSSALVQSFAQERSRAELEQQTPQAACGGNYGAVMGTFRTTPAYSNGSCSGGGSGVYQCVQFTDRVHPVTMFHIGNANTYNDGDNPRKMNMIWFANNNGTYGPKVGDIVVSDGGPYGHVGVFSAVPPTTVTVMDQNWSAVSGTHSHGRTDSNVAAMSGSYPVAGWLRPGWEFGGNLDSTSVIYGWTVRNARITSEDATGFTLDPGSDPGIVSPTGLKLDSGSGGYKYVKVRMNSKAPDGNVRVYFTTAAAPTWHEDRSAAATIATTGALTTVAVDMSRNAQWVASKVNQIRIDPANNGNAGATDLITIDKVWMEP